MSTRGEPTDTVLPKAEPAPPPPLYIDARTTLASHFLFGEGLEIGALHQPLAVPPHARARYVDRMTTEELRREYPELAKWDLTEVDVVDDGERLATIEDESQDFIVANHFLEHTENPIGTIETHLSKLKPGGVLFYAVPDMRFTFDFRRPVTPIEHMVDDYEQGPERSRKEHYEEWCRLVIDEESTGSAEEAASEEWVARRSRELEAAGYSIHMHAWTQAEFLRLILTCRERFGDGFDIEAAVRQAIELIVVLRKQGDLPAPAMPQPAPPPAVEISQAPAEVGELERWRSRLQKVLSTIRKDVRRWRERP
jgi:predicted SAM-dependent methyltransferase